MEESKKSSNDPHVLVLPLDIQGHINPMIEFCKRLVSKSVKTTLVNTVYCSKSMHVDNYGSINLQTISDGFDEGGIKQAENMDEYIERSTVVGSKSLANLIERLDATGNHVKALIYDGFLPWVLDVAKRYGLVAVVFFTQSCAVNSIYYHVNQKFLGLPLSGVVSIPGLPPLEPCETPSFVHIYGSYPSISKLVVYDQFSNINKVDWVLFNTFYELEKEVLNWMAKRWRVRTVGPTVPSGYLDKRLEDDKGYGINLFKPDNGVCMNWLNEKPSASVVYVSFGSAAELEAEQMEEIAWGLKNSNFYYLWVVRTSEMGKLPNNFMEEKPERGLMVNWSPQLEVLSHKSIGCFVTHCGLNSVLEAISLGVAMVGMPQWTDQPTNAKYVEDVWHVGVRTKPDEKGIVRRGELESCIREVMQGEDGKEIKRNAEKWKNLAKEAVDEGGSSDKNIDEFVAKLKFSS